jgi:hypothetical protein
MTDLKRTEQSRPDLSWDEAMRLAKTDASALAARLRGDKVLVPLAPSLWPTKRVRRVGLLRWAWQVTDHGTGEVLESGHAPTGGRGPALTGRPSASAMSGQRQQGRPSREGPVRGEGRDHARDGRGVSARHERQRAGVAMAGYVPRAGVASPRRPSGSLGHGGRPARRRRLVNVAHELSGVEASAIVAGLGAAGIPVVVRMQNHRRPPLSAAAVHDRRRGLHPAGVGQRTDAVVWHTEGA